MNHKKIAELAHVSISTVSKALSGSNDISSELAEKIRQIALETGYFAEKNKRKAANKRKKGANIAVICPEIISIHYSKIVTLLESFIDERGGRTAIYIYGFNVERLNELVQFLSTDGLTDGIIVLSSSRIENMPSVPIVSFDSFKNQQYYSIGVDINVVFDDIIKYLKELGHTKIGFVGEPRTTTKELAFRKSVEKYNLELNENFILKIEKRFADIGREAAISIIALGEDRPSAIITAYDEVAVSLIYDLEKAGIRVPEDISVVGLNDIPLAPYTRTSLTTVRFNYDEQAALAVDILYDKIYSENDSTEHLTVKHELIIRDSVAPVVK